MEPKSSSERPHLLAENGRQPRELVSIRSRIPLKVAGEDGAVDWPRSIQQTRGAGNLMGRGAGLENQWETKDASPSVSCVLSTLGSLRFPVSVSILLPLYASSHRCPRNKKKVTPCSTTWKLRI